MNSAEVIRTKWTPGTEEDRQAVRQALEQVLTSSHFCNSKRYPAFLRYVVEQSLNGMSDLIKERSIGIEVFGRSPNYDTNTDTVVRYTAGEVRKRLVLYYHEEAPDTLIQIHLSARCYLPEFLRAEDTVQIASTLDAQPNLSPAIDFSEPRSFNFSRELVKHKPRWRPGRWTAGILAMALAGVILFLYASRHRQGIDEFWSPMQQSKSPALISLGGVVFSPESALGTRVADENIANPFLSFENGLAMGRVAALLNSRGSDYRVQSSASTTLAQIRENPVVLVGAYNNAWTQRLLAPLRFHFAQSPNEEIIDEQRAGKIWSRDKSRPYANTPDYAIAARFRNPSTDSFVVVVAGLQRYGTDAASQFVVSPHLLNLLNEKVGANWAEKNVEVVLKVDVIDGRVGAPIIQDFYVW